MTEKSYRKRFIWSIVILVLAALAVRYSEILFASLAVIQNILAPFILGLAMAYILNLIIRPIEHFLFSKIRAPWFQKLKRPISIALALLSILAVIALTLYLVIPQLYTSFTVIGEGLPTLAKETKDWFLETTENLPWAQRIRNEISGIDLNWEDLASKVFAFMQNGLSGFLGSTVDALKSTIAGAVSWFTAFVFALYILADKESLGTQLHEVGHAYLKPSSVSKLDALATVFDDSFSRFFSGQVTDAFFLGVVLCIGMLIFRFPYALPISIVVMVTALIPMLGAFLGGAIGFIMISMTDFRQALLFIALLIVVQQIDENIIYPKVVGDAIGLPGIWVFVAVMIGGALAGAMGMLISVPLAAGLYKILLNDMDLRKIGKINESNDDVAQVDHGDETLP